MILSKIYFEARTRFMLLVFLSFLFGFNSCDTRKKNNENAEDTIQKEYLFTSIPSSETGINFVNTLEETEKTNYYQYMYTYIGAGVATGDINNDGLVDLYFTANSGPDKLYLNLGNLKFKDITEESGILQLSGFNTGVTMADVNGDGLLDIYVSRGGWLDEDGKFANLLYINQGNLKFKENAQELGLADANRTIQATFFDFDRDNDLDVYVSNTPDITGRTQILDLDKVHNDPKTLALKGSDRFYQNDGKGHFSDISEKAGLQNDIGFGLNPQVGDLNNDGWLDVYVCNDFNYPDLAYINNGDGTFEESRDKMFKHMSFNSMGSDIADMDNDGYLDLITLDMNPEDYKRAKLNMGMMPLSQFEMMVDQGYHHQYVHNMLQMNNGNGTFSEISKMAGMADTDWSWAVLAADFDLDGLNDLFITNGIFRDVMNRDVIDNTMDILRARGRKPTDEDFLEFTKMLPKQKLKNYLFKNNGNRTFNNSTDDWANLEPTLSNGATYADLDNDGDLEIIVNNINELATVLKNNAIEHGQGSFIKIDLNGPLQNKFGVGSKVTLNYEDGSVQTKQLISTRGFLSSVSNSLHFGLVKNSTPTKITVEWPDSSIREYTNFKINQSIRIDYNEGKPPSAQKKEVDQPLFIKEPFEFSHEDAYFNDFDLQLLLPHKLSQTGPGLAVADVDNDGDQEIYLGGGLDHPGQLIGLNDNGATLRPSVAFDTDKMYEDQGACFFDADGDGDQDLYVVSGSYEIYQNTELLQDRLYLNDGKGNFTKSKNGLPEIASSGSTVISGDYDNDGDIDLFVGGRVISGKYPYAPTSFILRNDNGRFSMLDKASAPELEKVGMITDAQWVDMNSDGMLDLVVTGEWMGIQLFLNKAGIFEKSNQFENLSNTKGWWNRLLVVDIDQDGDLDIIAGNLGLNHKLKASEEDPLMVYADDFDQNGSIDIILAKNINGKVVPVRGKVCLASQMPYLVNRIDTHEQFANMSLKEILGPKIENALSYEATEFRSGIFINNGEDSFSFQAFENSVQQSPINSIVFDDLDGDRNNDLLLAGNNYQSEIETTRADAGIGCFLKGNGKGNFLNIPTWKSGFFADKDVRNMALVKSKNGKLIFVANNNGKQDLFRVEQGKK
ncbi:Repeat domain-containing protein [Pricia antarctica]|uniref:Repeat domain-containing protein n=1 Tax=Pricia antarctica TaxID=641691 RepID=A0A1G7CSB6_9FLAO|nr:VCBS repeat-containing protein [Pricia antarctica]SDE42133.1 Repeat domain-containing protein [Pricia antarctica]